MKPVDCVTRELTSMSPMKKAVWEVVREPIWHGTAGLQIQTNAPGMAEDSIEVLSALDAALDDG